MEHLEAGNERAGAGVEPGGRGDLVNHYQTLNLEPGAPRVEVREAYLRLKSTYSAGSAALYSLISDEEAQAQLALVEDAFRVLGDEVSRRDYDRRFAVQFGTVPAPVVVAAGRPGATHADKPAEEVVAAAAASERLMRARELAGGNHWDASRPATVEPGGDNTVVRTTRQTLPIIKLKASRVGSDELMAQYGEMIAASDPGDGDLYRRMREIAEVTEDELQERTKVSIGYVRAIETNRFERLPQAVYVKGFLRSYFRYLGVQDAEKLVAAFSTRLAAWQTSRKT